MEKVTTYKSCTACEACVSICPQNAIYMENDHKGFRYPVINQNKCVDCNLCVRCCPANSEVKRRNDFSQRCYAFRHDDTEVLMNSSSGGFFTALSDYVLENSGIVYGVGYDEEMMPIYQRATTVSERNKFRGAKYVQAKVGSIFTCVKTDLEEGKIVLFVGNPCHIAGLDKYLQQTYSNLLLVDIVCNGVASPGIWKNYLDILEARIGKINAYAFRDKNQGWHGAKLKIVTTDGREEYNTRYSKSYVELCFAKYSIRESCADCKYKTIERKGDFTIGDFWGYDERHPEFQDEKGVSLVLVNSQKGNDILKTLHSKIQDKLVPESLAEIPQTNINKVGISCPDSDTFWKDYQRRGYEYVAKKYTNYGMRNYIHSRIKNALKCFIIE